MRAKRWPFKLAPERLSAAEFAALASLGKRNKFGAVKATVDGIVFDSKREAKRFQELLLLAKGGYICNLELQPEFRFEIDGNLMFKYIADFAYFEGTQRTVEDVKGVRTALYKIKKKIVEAAFKVKIIEV